MLYICIWYIYISIYLFSVFCSVLISIEVQSNAANYLQGESVELNAFNVRLEVTNYAEGGVARGREAA